MYDYQPTQKPVAEVRVQNPETRQQEKNLLLAGLVAQQFSFAINPNQDSSSLNQTGDGQKVALTYGEEYGEGNISTALNDLFNKFYNQPSNNNILENSEINLCKDVIDSYYTNYGYKYGRLPELLQYAQAPENIYERKIQVDAYICKLIWEIQKINYKLLKVGEKQDVSYSDFKPYFSERDRILGILNSTIKIRQKILKQIQNSR